MLTAEIDDTSFAFGGCRRQLAAHTLTSACTSSSDMFGNSHRKTSVYLSNASLTNSHIVVSEMTFFGNRNASVNAAFCYIEKRSFMSKLMASKAGMNTVTVKSLNVFIPCSIGPEPRDCCSLQGFNVHFFMRGGAKPLFVFLLCTVSEKKYSLICSTFKGTLNQLHFILLFIFHLISFFCFLMSF